MVWPKGKTRPESGQGQGVNFVLSHLDYQAEGCLKWPFSRRPNGYGALQYKMRTWLAHRFMCQMIHGDPPTEDHEAAHSCGNGHEGCVNPRHLSWKTRAENQQERHVHRRRPRGPAGRKLTSEQVDQIRLLASTSTRDAIAARFGVSRATIIAILGGRIWSPDKKRPREFSRSEIIKIRAGRRKIRAQDLAAQFNTTVRTVRSIQYGESYSYIREGA